MHIAGARGENLTFYLSLPNRPDNPLHLVLTVVENGY